MLQELVEGQENLYPVGLEGQASEDHLTSIESLDQEYNSYIPTYIIHKPSFITLESFILL